MKQCHYSEGFTLRTAPVKNERYQENIEELAELLYGYFCQLDHKKNHQKYIKTDSTLAQENSDAVIHTEEISYG